MRKLSKIEINEINKISDVNKKKDLLQSIIISEWNKTKKGLISAFTGMGKSICILKIIQQFNIDFPNEDVIIISPFTKLRDDFQDKISKFGLKNTKSVTLQSYSAEIKRGEIKTTSLLIVDESHTCANIESEFFSKVLPKTNYKYIACFSATYEDNHLRYYSELGLELLFDITVEQGFTLKMVPDSITYCLGVKLTPEEEIQYLKIQSEYDGYISYFSQFDPNNPIGLIRALSQSKNKKIHYQGFDCTSKDHSIRIGNQFDVNPGSLIGTSMKWMGCTSRRASFLNNSKNLIAAAIYILKKIDEKVLVFCSGKENIKYMMSQLPKSVGYYSGMTEKQLKESLNKFENEDYLYMLSVRKLDLGYDKADLRIGLQYNYSSKKVQFIQRSGRFKRFDPKNPSKYSVFIALYIDDFIDKNGKLILSPQKKWLKSSLRNRNFIEWLSHPDEIKI